MLTQLTNVVQRGPDTYADLQVRHEWIAEGRTVTVEMRFGDTIEVKLIPVMPDGVYLRLPGQAWEGGGDLLLRVCIDADEFTASSSPDEERPQTPDAPHSVTLVGANAFRMPHKCVICGVPVSGLFSYTQDHMPVLLPGMGFVRTTQVSLPYCVQHRNNFENRFRKLRLTQRIAAAMFAVGGFTIVFEPARAAFGRPPEPGLIASCFVLMLLLFLAITIFCVKPFLYDVFIKRSGNRIRIKSRSSLFIKNVIEQNQALVR